MDSGELVRWAEGEASAQLSGMGDRWRHVQAVAARAYEAGRVLDEDDRTALIGAAWLHDVGYAPSLAITGFHPLDGARYVRALGHERIAGLVAYHSSAQWEAEALGLAHELAAFPHEDSATSDALTYCDMTTSPHEDSATSDALTYCDMTTSPTGQRVTLAARLAEIAERYGTEHLVVRCLERAHDHLVGAVQRTEERLRAGSVPE